MLLGITIFIDSFIHIFIHCFIGQFPTTFRWFYGLHTWIKIAEIPHHVVKFYRDQQMIKLFDSAVVQLKHSQKLQETSHLVLQLIRTWIKTGKHKKGELGIFFIVHKNKNSKIHNCWKVLQVAVVCFFLFQTLHKNASKWSSVLYIIKVKVLPLHCLKDRYFRNYPICPI